MSLKSFLAKIFYSIKTFWTGLEPELKVAVGIGVLVTQNLKNFVFSPGMDVLAAIIPNGIGAEIETILRSSLPGLLIHLQLVDATLGLTDPNEIMAAAIKTLQSLNVDVKNPFFHNISILVAQLAADGKLTWSDGVYLLEYYYQNEFKAAA